MSVFFARTLAHREDQWNRQFMHVANNETWPDPKKLKAALAELDRQLIDARKSIDDMIQQALSESVLAEIINDTYPTQQDN
jgi:hypothetical protein